MSILQENLNYSPAPSVVYKREGVMLSSLHAHSASFPRLSFSPKCNSTLPHRGKDSSPSKCKISTNPSYKLCFVSFFFFFFHYYLFIHFSPKLWILPQSEKSYSPAFGANNRRIDTHENLSGCMVWPARMNGLPLQASLTTDSTRYA